MGRSDSAAALRITIGSVEVLDDGRRIVGVHLGRDRERDALEVADRQVGVANSA
jgi:hypothetical protein